jgi:hypothetical protein
LSFKYGKRYKAALAATVFFCIAGCLFVYSSPIKKFLIYKMAAKPACQKMHLSDQEKIRIAVKAAYNRSYLSISNTKKEKGGVFKQVPYASVDEFLKRNPKCCKVVYDPTMFGDRDQSWDIGYERIRAIGAICRPRQNPLRVSLY